MSKKSEERAARLTALLKERDELEAAIENLIADMAEQPETARREGDWATDGASTRRYLDLSNRLGDIEHDIADLTRELTAAADEKRPN